MAARTKLLRAALLAGAHLVALESATAYAQEQANPTGLEEIVVTAQRREESLQKVPIAAEAFSEAAIERMQIRESTDVAQLVPNVSINNSYGNANPIVVIRGVGLQDFSANIRPGVAFYVDDVYLSSPAMAGFALYDVERIELLKGPQGTLYGRNTTGGAVNFITRKPSRSLEGYVKLNLGNYESYGAEAAVSGPISNRVAARLSGLIRRRDEGTQYNVVQARDQGRYEQAGVRGQLLVEPTETLTLLLAGSAGYNHSEPVSAKFFGLQGAACPVRSGVYDAALCTSRFGFRDLDPDPTHVTSDAPIVPFDTNFKDASLRVDWELGDVTLTSLSAYSDFVDQRMNDLDSTPVPQASAINNFHNPITAYSQELRLAGASEGLKWIVGLYHGFDQVKSDSSIEEAPGLFRAQRLFNINQGARDNRRAEIVFEQETRSNAAFGQVDWTFAPRWELTLGARYTEDVVKFDAVNYWVFFDGLSPERLVINLNGTDPVAMRSKESFPYLSKRAVLTFTPSERSLLYASYSDGFKSGGNSGNIAFNSATLAPYKKETVQAYELGYKGTLMDGLARVNAAAYYYDYRNMQAAVFEQVGTTVVSKLGNIGAAELYGLELKLELRPTEGLLVDASGAWANTEVTSNTETSDPVFGRLSLKGKELPHAPELSGDLRVSYEHELAGGRVGALAHYHYSDGYFVNVTNTEFIRQKAFGLINLSTWWTSPDRAWRVSLWGKNLTNKIVRNRAVSTNGTLNLYHQEPRTYGLTLERQF